MQSHRIPARRKPQAPTLGLVTLAVAGIVGFGMLTGWATKSTPEPTGTVHTTDQPDPAVFTPLTPRRETKLELREQPLSDMARRYREVSLNLPACPLCFGVDKPVIAMTPNERVLFAALIGSESNWGHWDEAGNLKPSSIGCLGIAQLCFSLATPENLASPEASLYAAAGYFHDLVNQNGGDLVAAILQYKGSTTPDTAWVADTVFDRVQIVTVGE